MKLLSDDSIIIKKIANSPVIRVILSPAPGFGDQANSKQQLDHLLALIIRVTGKAYRGTVEIIYESGTRAKAGALFGLSQVNEYQQIAANTFLLSQEYYHTHQENFNDTFLGLVGGDASENNGLGYYKTEFFSAISPHIEKSSSEITVWHRNFSYPILEENANTCVKYPVPTLNDASHFIAKSVSGVQLSHRKPGVIALLENMKQNKIETIWVYGMNTDFVCIDVKYTIIHLLLALKNSLKTDKPLVIVLANQLTRTEKNVLYQLLQQLHLGSSENTEDHFLLSLARKLNFSMPIILNAKAPNSSLALHKLLPGQISILDMGTIPKTIFDAMAAQSLLVIGEGANIQTLMTTTEKTNHFIHCNPHQRYHDVLSLYELGGTIPSTVKSLLAEIETYSCFPADCYLHDRSDLNTNGGVSVVNATLHRTTELHLTAINTLSNFIRQLSNSSSETFTHLRKAHSYCSKPENDRLLTALRLIYNTTQLSINQHTNLPAEISKKFDIKTATLPQLKHFLLTTTPKNYEVLTLLSDALKNRSPDISLYMIENNILNCKNKVGFSDLLWFANRHSQSLDLLIDAYLNRTKQLPHEDFYIPLLLKANKEELTLAAIAQNLITLNTTFDSGRYTNIPALLHPSLSENAFNFLLQRYQNNTLSLSTIFTSDYLEAWQELRESQSQFSLIQSLHSAAGNSTSTHSNPLLNLPQKNDEAPSHNHWFIPAVSYTLGFIEAALKDKGYKIQNIYLIIDFIGLACAFLSNQSSGLFSFMLLRTFLNFTLHNITNIKIITPIIFLLLSIAEKLFENTDVLLDRENSISTLTATSGKIAIDVVTQASTSVICYGLGNLSYTTGFRFWNACYNSSHEQKKTDDIKTAKMV